MGVKLSEISDQFVYKNYELLKEQNIFLQEKIIDLNNRIAQIDEIDFRKRFENANSDYFQNLERITSEKIGQFDDVKNNLSTTGQHFTGEVERLKTVDLELVITSSNEHIKKTVPAKNKYLHFKDYGALEDAFEIKAEDLSKISEAFFTTKKNGTGLGMSLSTEIVKLHNGTIKYESKYKKGTKVLISLHKID